MPILYESNKGVADTQIMHDWQNNGQTHEWRRSLLIRARLASSDGAIAKGDDDPDT